jgi:hypothetical protein
LIDSSDQLIGGTGGGDAREKKKKRGYSTFFDSCCILFSLTFTYSLAICFTSDVYLTQIVDGVLAFRHFEVE